MKYEDFLELAQKRRSIRKFKTDPISDDDIKKIIDPVRYAPSGFNSQLWEFSVIRKPELKKRIADLITDGRRAMFSKNNPQAAPNDLPKPPAARGFEKAPILIIVMGDIRVRQMSHIPIVKTNDMEWASIKTSSLAIAFQYAALAATSLGLGSQWVSSIKLPSVESKVKELLGIPAEIEIYDMLAVGVPDLTPPDKKVRPLEEIIHFDECGEDDFRTEEQVRKRFGK